MYFGENVVAQAWSFTDEVKEIPYLIKRVSRQNRNGMTHKWFCSCPSSRFHKTTCKHILALRNSAKIGFLPYDKRFSVSDLGKEILKSQF